MIYLQTMHDHQLKIDYKLYRANAKELSERLYSDYGLDKVTIQTFNSNSRLGEQLLELEEKKIKGYDTEIILRKVEETKKMIEENRHVSPMTKIGISFGYELMPIAVSCEGDFEDRNTKLELLDGFNRMFCSDEVPSIEILVKVYPNLSDADWINSMLVYNSWKFSDGSGAGRYMDRGFQLGLHYRYDLRFMEMAMPDWDMFRYINLYVKGNDLNTLHSYTGNTIGAYTTFWNNDCFADDLTAIYEIMNAKPVFRLKKRRKPEEIYDMGEKTRPGYLLRILEVFVSLLGEIRKYEFQQKLTNRKIFDRNVLYNYLSDESLQKHFVKIIVMTVDGFACNFIRDHLREDIKKRMYESMGYPYHKKAEYKHIKLTDNMV